MTKEEYQDFILRYKGCGACFPLFEKLNRFEKMWFTAIQKDVFELEKAYNETEELLDKQIEETYKLFKENANLKEDNKVMSDNYSKMEQKFYDNLTQAKELLARWVSDKPYTVLEQKDLISDTKQFLRGK